MKNMYIAACDPDGGIYRYIIDGGKVIPAGKTSLNSPMYMEIKDGRLYCVLRDPNNTGESGVISFAIEKDGNLGSSGPVISTKGKVGCHLTVSDSGIFVANYISGSVFKSPDKLVTHTGGGPVKDRQEGPHTHCTMPTPDGKYICVADLGTDEIYMYDMALNTVSVSKLPAGSGPRHVVFSSDGNYMYCVTELSNEVFSFKYKEGNLQQCESISTLPADYCGKNTAAAIRLQNGLLYASNRGHNSIAVIKAEGEKLELKNIVSCLGEGPRDFNICEDLLVSTNEDSNTCTFFKLCDGIPKPMDIKLKLPRPLNVIFYDSKK